MNRVDAVRDAVHQRLLAEFTPGAYDHRDALMAHLRVLVFEHDPMLEPLTVDAVVTELINIVSGLGGIEPLLCDPAISEIMLNGPGRAYVERNGAIEVVALNLSAAAIESIAQRVIAPLGLRLDRSSPMVDARLSDGSRLHAVLPPLAPDGPVVTIRRFATRTIELDDFGMDQPTVEFLSSAIVDGANILIAGATNAGKTTLLNALAACIEPCERVVTIEETAELALRQPHVVRLEAHPANSEGAGEVTVRDLVRASLRMRPDRLIIGEVRGGEALDLLQALNTGHAGSMCTIHANSAVDALSRLETLTLLSGIPLPIEAVRSQIHSAVDLVVFVARGSGGQRTVQEIIALRPVDQHDAFPTTTILQVQQ